jgi:soluble lytic murein transglycosylase-like protein
MAVARRTNTLEPLAVMVLVAALGSCAGRGNPAPAPVPAPVADAAPVPPPEPEAVRPAVKKAIAKRPRPPVARVDSAALERQMTARFAHRPLAQVLARRTRRPDVADRAAIAVVREADRLRMSPSLLAAVLLVENRPLDTAAVSSAGAVGLMQVMPMHAGSYGCASTELREIDANICHGARLLHMYVARTRSVKSALRRYNGCVRGTNTPRCHRYAPRVLRLASALRRDMLMTAQSGLMVATTGSSARASR